MSAHTDDDPVEQVRQSFAKLCEGLERNVTIQRGETAVESALKTVEQWAELISTCEAPRQAAVAQARAERAERERIEAERAAAEKSKRVQSRQALRATLKGKAK